MTVAQLLNGMDSRELSEWIQFDILEAEAAERRAIEQSLASEVNTKLARRRKY